MALEPEKESLRINSKKLEDEAPVEERKQSYPYMSLGFIMAAAILQRYARTHIISKNKNCSTSIP